MQTFQTDQCLRHDLNFAPDGRRLLVGSPTRVLLDTLGTEPPLALTPPTGAFTAYAQLVLGGRALVYTTPTDNPHLHLWELEPDRVVVREEAGRDVKDLAVSPDGATVYAARVVEHRFSWLTELLAFDAASGELRERFTARDGFFADLIVSADGRRLAGYGSYTVGVWGLTEGSEHFAEVRIGKAGLYVNGVALSADGTRLATVTRRGLTLWDVTGAATQEVFRSGKHKRRVTAVACNPLHPLIATGDNAGAVFLWDHTGRVRTRFDWKLGEVMALAFAPDGLRCAAADDKGKLVIWDVDV